MAAAALRALSSARLAQASPFRVTPQEYLLGISDIGCVAARWRLEATQLIRARRSGELMRYATNAVAAGHYEVPLEVCEFTRRLYEGFASCPGHIKYSSAPPRTPPCMQLAKQGGSRVEELLTCVCVVRDLPKKRKVLMDCVKKVERVRYKIKLRGAEVPSSELARLLSKREGRATQGDDDAQLY